MQRDRLLIQCFYILSVNWTTFLKCGSGAESMMNSCLQFGGFRICGIEIKSWTPVFFVHIRGEECGERTTMNDLSLSHPPFIHLPPLSSSESSFHACYTHALGSYLSKYSHIHLQVRQSSVSNPNDITVNLLPHSVRFEWLDVCLSVFVCDFVCTQKLLLSSGRIVCISALHHHSRKT